MRLAKLRDALCALRSAHQTEMAQMPAAVPDPGNTPCLRTTVTRRKEFGLGQPRVLIVEDQCDDAETLRRFLELVGYDVKVAHTGPEGLRLAREWLPEVALCDIGLPGMSGWELARELRRDPKTAGIQLLAVTGYGSEADWQRSREAGFEKHFVKPVDPADLADLLV